MIKIKVYPGPFVDDRLIDEDGIILIDEGSRVRDLLKILKIPRAVYKLGLYSLNYKTVPIDEKLEDGDEFSFISPISGG